jgi:solute:Na+ symporter, SSS family
LGIFLVGLFTKHRGSDLGNGIAMLFGFLVVAYLSGLDRDVARLINPAWNGLHRPEAMPIIEFPWRIMFGTIATAAVALCFRSEGANAAKLAA